jgi:hypothetical protein
MANTPKPEAPFEAYELGQSKVSAMYVIWRAGFSVQERVSLSQYA